MVLMARRVASKEEQHGSDVCASFGRGSRQAADSRIEILKEVVSAIKAVKFFAWEEPYLDKISDERLREIIGIRKYRMLVVTSLALGRASPALGACASIVT
jgi:hypothetical protein